MTDDGVSGPARRLLEALQRMADEHGWVRQGEEITVAEIAQAMYCSERSIQRHLRELAAGGHTYHRSTGRGLIVFVLAACRTAQPKAPRRSDGLAVVADRDWPERKPPAAETAWREEPGAEMLERALAAIAPGMDARLPGLVLERARKANPDVGPREAALLLSAAMPGDGYRVLGRGFWPVAAANLAASIEGRFAVDLWAGRVGEREAAEICSTGLSEGLRKIARAWREMGGEYALDVGAEA